jgi:hypothetical protein
LPAWPGFWPFHLFAYEDLSVALLDSPARNRAERWSVQGLTGAQIETGMMPGTAHRLAIDEPFAKRTVIVGAVGTDGKEFGAAPHQQDVFIADVTD